MPHKRNPILSERIAGPRARCCAATPRPAFENQPLWHERDISHSSAERVILPDATIVLDYLLVKAAGLVEGLVVRPERMRENIERGLGLHASLAGAARPRRAGRPVARGRVRDRPAQRAPRGRRAGAAPAACSRRTRSVAQRLPLAGARRVLRRRGVPAPRARRSSPGSTRSRRRSGPAPTPRPEGGRRCRSLRRSSGRARSATCTASTTTGCCSSRRTGCRRSTSSCPRRSRTRAASSPGLSRFWFARDGRDIVPNHLLSTDPADVPGRASRAATRRPIDELRGRMMLGRPAEVLPIECVVRGYLSGSGWKEYRRDGRRVRHPAARRPARVGSPARRRSSRRPGRRPRASTTRTSPFERVVELVGRAARGARCGGCRSALYELGAAVCAKAGIILADTKFEFGVLPDGELILIDEVMTPDSLALLGRRRLPAGPRRRRATTSSSSATGCETQPWPKTAPGPALPADVVAGTRAALRRGLRTNHRGELRPLSRGGRDRPMSEPTRAYRFAVNVTPKPGILDPQGKAVERSLPHLGIAGVTGVRVGPPRRAGGDRGRRGRRPRGRRAARRASCCRTRSWSSTTVEALAEAEAPRRRRGSGRMSVRVGDRPVPGLQPRHRRGQRADGRRRGAGDPVARGHRPRRTSSGVLLPGRVRVRRLPPGRRHRPVQPGHARGRGLRGPRRPGAGDLQRLPGARRGGPRARARCCATAALRFVCREVALVPERLDSPFTREIDGAAPAPDAGRARRGLLLRRRRDARRARARRPGPVALRRRRRLGRRPRRPRQPERLAARDRGRRATPRATSPGLMPHPETAVEALIGSATAWASSARSS